MKINRFNVYECPICHKQYKRKGFYLNKHLQKCNAIAWIPKTKIEITMNQIEEDKLADALENGFSFKNEWKNKPKQPNNQVKREALPAFKEYKELVNNGGIKLTHVPESELNHIYNIFI